MDSQHIAYWLMLLLNACFGIGMILIIIKNLKKIERLKKENKKAIDRMNTAILEFEKGEKNEDTFD